MSAAYGGSSSSDRHYRGALHDLAFDGEHGAATRDLFLAFAQPVDAAKVRGAARQHVESTRNLEPRVAVNEQLSAIGHLAVRRPYSTTAARRWASRIPPSAADSGWLMTTAVLRTENLTKTFSETRALAAVSIEIRSREIMGLVADGAENRLS